MPPLGKFSISPELRDRLLLSLLSISCLMGFILYLDTFNKFFYIILIFPLNILLAYSFNIKHKKQCNIVRKLIFFHISLIINFWILYGDTLYDFNFVFIILGSYISLEIEMGYTLFIYYLGSFRSFFNPYFVMCQQGNGSTNSGGGGASSGGGPYGGGNGWGPNPGGGGPNPGGGGGLYPGSGHRVRHHHHNEGEGDMNESSLELDRQIKDCENSLRSSQSWLTRSNKALSKLNEEIMVKYQKRAELISGKKSEMFYLNESQLLSEQVDAINLWIKTEQDINREIYDLNNILTNWEKHNKIVYEKKERIKILKELKKQIPKQP